MRVAIVTETFQPDPDPLSNTVRQLATQLQNAGHSPLIIAPGRGPLTHETIPVVRNRSVVLPGARAVPLIVPGRAVEHTLEGFAPDVVHLASPMTLGALGLNAARRLGIPTVADYQIDTPRGARRHGPVHDGVDHWVARLHRRCDRTLVPSRCALRKLEAQRVPNLHLWAPGVDAALFHPGRRSDELHTTWQRSIGGPDRVVVGFVGQLIVENQVGRLTELAGVAGVGLVVIGDGPERQHLEQALPEAVFTGVLQGERLAEAVASLDIVVDPRVGGTFCSVVQDAQASGTAVVAPASGAGADNVDHRRTGLLYDPSEPASLRRSVARLAWDRGLRQSLAAAASADIPARSWTRVVDELVGRHYTAAVEANADRSVAAPVVLGSSFDRVTTRRSAP